MILTLMLIILTATLVIVIIGFVMDRLEIRKIQSGMRKMYRKIKTMEDEQPRTMFCVNDKMYEVELEDGDEMDSDTDTAAETADGGDIPTEANGEVQETGD